MCYYYWKMRGIRPSEIYNALPEKSFYPGLLELELEEKNS